MKKAIKYLSTLIVGLILIGFIGIKFIAPYAITQPPRISEDLTPEKLELLHNKLTIKATDHIDLVGYWIKTKADTAKGIMILIHGVGGCKEHFLGLAKELSQQGIASVLFDGRAHGKSGGEYCTYGFHEKQDISKIVDHIKKQQPDLPIGIWGNSLGGAIAIQALELDKRIEFGIIESRFTELDQIVFDYKKNFLKGFGIKSLSDYALKCAGEIANFNPDEVKPIESIKNITQPLLIAHGDADKNISFEYGKALFENLKPLDKEFVLVKGGGHFDLYDKGGVEYKKKIINFIERHLK